MIQVLSFVMQLLQEKRSTKDTQNYIVAKLTGANLTHVAVNLEKDFSQ